MIAWILVFLLGPALLAGLAVYLCRGPRRHRRLTRGQIAELQALADVEMREDLLLCGARGRAGLLLRSPGYDKPRQDEWSDRGIGIRCRKWGAAVGERWDTAVAATAEEPPADLRAAVEEELIALWNDLNEALRRAAGRCWTAECDGLVVRIVMLSRLTTATSWPWIPAPLLASGIYQGILEAADIEFTPPPADQLVMLANMPGS